MSTAPYRVHSSRQASRKPARGGTTPMLPATGSTMSAADLFAARHEQLSQAVDVVVRDEQRVRRGAPGDARAVRQRQRRDTAAGAAESASAWPW